MEKFRLEKAAAAAKPLKCLELQQESLYVLVDIQELHYLLEVGHLGINILEVGHLGSTIYWR